MARFGCATFIGPTVNSGDGDGRPLEPEDGMSAYYYVVLHIQEGTEAGTEAWQRNPAANVSSHFLLPKAGGVRQMVDTHDRSWCQVAGNRTGISVECEGRAGDALTPAQVEGAAQILAEAHRRHGVPLRLCDSPSVSRQADGGLIYHGAGGAAWGGHYGCPGPRIVAQRPTILARAQQLAGQPAPSPTQEADVNLTDRVPSASTPDNSNRTVDQVLGDLWRGVHLHIYGIESTVTALATKVDGLSAGGAPTQDQVDAAVAKVMTSPQFLSGLGAAVASHIHVA